MKRVAKKKLSPNKMRIRNERRARTMLRQTPVAVDAIYADNLGEWGLINDGSVAIQSPVELLYNRQPQSLKYGATCSSPPPSHNNWKK